MVLARRLRVRVALCQDIMQVPLGRAQSLLERSDSVQTREADSGVLLSPAQHRSHRLEASVQSWCCFPCARMVQASREQRLGRLLKVCPQPYAAGPSGRRSCRRKELYWYTRCKGLSRRQLASSDTWKIRWFQVASFHGECVLLPCPDGSSRASVGISGNITKASLRG